MQTADVALVRKIWRAFCDDLAEDVIILAIDGQPGYVFITKSSTPPGSSRRQSKDSSSSSSHGNLSKPYDSSTAAASAARERFQQELLGALPVMVAVGCALLVLPLLQRNRRSADSDM